MFLNLRKSWNNRLQKVLQTSWPFLFKSLCFYEPSRWPSVCKCVVVVQLCPTLCDPRDCSSPGSSVHGILQARILEWVHFLLQGIFPTQGLNSVPLYCRRILYHLSHQGSPDDLLSSVQFSRSVVSDSLRPHESQHARPPCPSPTPGVHTNPCPSSRWCHPAISSSVIPSPPAPNPSQHQGLFQWVNSLHEGQGIGVSPSASVLPMNTQGWSPRWPPGWLQNFAKTGLVTAITSLHSDHFSLCENMAADSKYGLFWSVYQGMSSLKDLSLG